MIRYREGMEKLITGFKRSEKFDCKALRDQRKKKEAQKKALRIEIDRRNDNNDVIINN